MKQMASSWLRMSSSYLTVCSKTALHKYGHSISNVCGVLSSRNMHKTCQKSSVTNAQLNCQLESVHKLTARKISFHLRHQPSTFVMPSRHLYSSVQESVVSTEAVDDVSKSIMNTQSTVDLMNMLSILSVENLTAEHTWLFTRELLHKHYGGLATRLQWLQNNIHVAHIQLHLRDSVTELSKPIVEHPNFSKWYGLLDRNCRMLTDCQLADCFMSMLYLDLKHDDPLLHKLLIISHEKLPSFNVQALATMSIAIKALPGFNFFAINAIGRQMQSLTQMAVPPRMTADDLAATCVVLINTLKFTSIENGNKHLVWLHDYLRTHEMSWNPEHLGIILRMAQKMSGYCNQMMKPLTNEIITRITGECYQLVDSFTGSHIAEICNPLKVCLRYEKGLAKLVEERASSLLTDDSRLCDVTNLMYALTRNSPRSTIHRFESALHARLLRNDVDIIILSNIADTLLETSLDNHDLMALFQRHVANQGHDIIKFISRYNKIVKVLMRRRFLDPKLEAEFIEKLVAHLDSQHGIQLYTISSLANFMLPSSYAAVPQSFLDKLLTAIPHMQVRELYRLAHGINSVRQPMTGCLRHQLSLILSCLHTTLIDKLDNIETFDYLCQLTLGLVIYCRSRDPTLTDRLMGIYPQYTKDLTESGVLRVAQMFQSISYYLPEVYDDIVSFIIKCEDSLQGETILWALSSCAKVGYQPTNMDAFVDVCCRLYQKLFLQRSMKTALQLLSNLSVLQAYPEKELSKLFTLEVIEDLERYMKGKYM